jgi:uncharacterized membrane protein YfcA
MIPVLTAVFGLTPSVAVGTASLYTFLTKIYATHRHIRLHTIDYKISGLFITGAVPGSALASYFINARAKSENQEEFQEHLRACIVGVMLLSEVMMISRYLKSSSSVPPHGPTASSDLETSDLEVPDPKVIVMDQGIMNNINSDLTLSYHGALSRIFGDLCNQPSRPWPTPDKLFAGLIISLFVGGMVGATAIGAGIIVIPTLLIFFHVSPSQAVGSCIFIGLIITLVSSAVYSHGGTLDLFTGILSSLGSIVGVYYGSALSVKVSEKNLQATLIIVIFVSAVVMVFT